MDLQRDFRARQVFSVCNFFDSGGSTTVFKRTCRSKLWPLENILSGTISYVS
jgi:hypothetical protein